MTPDEIKEFVEANYKDIVTDRRNRPDGWSFFYEEIRKGPKSTRIARVVEGSGGKANEFKCSATSRWKQEEVTCEIRSRERLREVFDEELRVWKQNFGGQRRR
jgi:hypothetical protein